MQQYPNQWQGQPQQPYYPPQWQLQQPPPKKKSRAGVFIVLGIAAVLIFSCIGFAAIAASQQQSAITAPAVVQSAGTNATQAPAQGKWTTTHTFSGNGTKKTPVFAVPGDWKILWKCDPSSSFGGQYNLIVSVTGSDGSAIDPTAINTICKAGNTHDVTEEHQSGQVYLDVESEGSWTIQVQELK